MVSNCAKWLNENGHFDVRADLVEYASIPGEINWTGNSEGHIPDITTNSKIFEIETADSISDDHTADQWALFAAYAEQTKKEFWVVVPMGNLTKAEERLKGLRISAKIWEV